MVIYSYYFIIINVGKLHLNPKGIKVFFHEGLLIKYVLTHVQ